MAVWPHDFSEDFESPDRDYSDYFEKDQEDQSKSDPGGPGSGASRYLIRQEGSLAQRRLVIKDNAYVVFNGDDTDDCECCVVEEEPEIFRSCNYKANGQTCPECFGLWRTDFLHGIIRTCPNYDYDQIAVGVTINVKVNCERGMVDWNAMPHCDASDEANEAEADGPDEWPRFSAFGKQTTRACMRQLKSDPASWEMCGKSFSVNYSFNDNTWNDISGGNKVILLRHKPRESRRVDGEYVDGFPSSWCHDCIKATRGGVGPGDNLEVTDGCILDHDYDCRGPGPGGPGGGPGDINLNCFSYYAIDVGVMRLGSAGVELGCGPETHCGEPPALGACTGHFQYENKPYGLPGGQVNKNCICGSCFSPDSSSFWGGVGPWGCRGASWPGDGLYEATVNPSGYGGAGCFGITASVGWSCLASSLFGQFCRCVGETAEQVYGQYNSETWKIECSADSLAEGSDPTNWVAWHSHADTQNTNLSTLAWAYNTSGSGCSLKVHQGSASIRDGGTCGKCNSGWTEDSECTRTPWYGDAVPCHGINTCMPKFNTYSQSGSGYCPECCRTHQLSRWGNSSADHLWNYRVAPGHAYLTVTSINFEMAQEGSFPP